MYYPLQLNIFCSFFSCLRSFRLIKYDYKTKYHNYLCYIFFLFLNSFLFLSICSMLLFFSFYCSFISPQHLFSHFSCYIFHSLFYVFLILSYFSFIFFILFFTYFYLFIIVFFIVLLSFFNFFFFLKESFIIINYLLEYNIIKLLTFYFTII